MNVRPASYGFLFVVPALLLLLAPYSPQAQETSKVRALADSLFAKEQWEKAGNAYHELAEDSHGEEHSYALYKEGICLQKQGKYPEAVAVWYKLLISDKETQWSAHAMEQAAEISIAQLDKKEEGMWLYEWLIERFPGHPVSTSLLQVIRKLKPFHDLTRILLKSEDLPGDCRYFRESSILHNREKRAFQVWCLLTDKPKEHSTKYRVYYFEFEDMLAPQPVKPTQIMEGNYSQYETEGIRRLNVVFDDSGKQYRLWTCSYYTSGWKTEIRYFTSPDGVHWEEGPRPFSSAHLEDNENPVAVQLSDGTVRLYYIHQDTDGRPYQIYRCDIPRGSAAPVNNQNTGLSFSSRASAVAFSDNHHRLWLGGSECVETFDGGKTWPKSPATGFNSERFLGHFATFYEPGSQALVYLCITNDQQQLVLTTDCSISNADPGDQ